MEGLGREVDDDHLVVADVALGVPHAGRDGYEAPVGLAQKQPRLEALSARPRARVIQRELDATLPDHVAVVVMVMEAPALGPAGPGGRDGDGGPSPWPSRAGWS